MNSIWLKRGLVVVAAGAAGITGRLLLREGRSPAMTDGSDPTETRPGQSAAVPSRPMVQVPERPPSQADRAEDEAKMRRVREILTSSEQLSAAVPQPLALRAVLGAGVSPLRAYNRELRNPVWAPAMESGVREALAEELARQLPGVSLDIECRTSICRATIEAEPEVERQIKDRYPSGKRDFALASELLERVGPLGRTQREAILESGRPAIVFALDERGIDPAGYRAWRRGVWEQTEANLRAVEKSKGSSTTTERK
jgi:hypothetical protein